MTDYQETFASFWAAIVCNPDGSLIVDQVKRELHDYCTLMESAGKVFYHVTDGAISKPNTCPDVVCALADDVINRQLEEAIAEERERFAAEASMPSHEDVLKLAASCPPLNCWFPEDFDGPRND